MAAVEVMEREPNEGDPTGLPICAGCWGEVAEGCGLSYAGTVYHRRECIPPDLAICEGCDSLEDARRVEDGKCEGCRDMNEEAEKEKAPIRANESGPHFGR